MTSRRADLVGPLSTGIEDLQVAVGDPQDEVVGLSFALRPRPLLLAFDDGSAVVGIDDLVTDSKTTLQSSRKKGEGQQEAAPREEEAPMIPEVVGAATEPDRIVGSQPSMATPPEYSTQPISFAAMPLDVRRGS